MKKSSHRRSRRRQLQASHQKNWLVGFHAVVETLRAGRWMAEDIYVADDIATASRDVLTTLAAKHQIVVRNTTVNRLTELCGAQHHQGVAARMRSYEYASDEDLWQQLESASSAAEFLPLIVICDRIQDSYNFGAVLRCCDAVRVDAVVIGRSHQVGVTPQVARSSAGAVNHLPVVLSDDLTAICEGLKQREFQIAAASEKAEHSVWHKKLHQPTALIVGNEAHGPREELLAVCDLQLRIPMLGQVTSLNAAVATGVLLYEFRRQQSGRD